MNAVKSRAAAESALREGKPSTSSLLPVVKVTTPLANYANKGANNQSLVEPLPAI